MLKKKTNNILLTIATILTLTSCILSSCNDDIEYTTSPDAHLTFKQDTIRLDTIFTETTSVTKRFCVYNYNSKYVRIKSIRLESQGDSGFMINADSESGNIINDISIGDHDSISVFVKARLATQNNLKPQLVSDHVIFTMENGNEYKVRLEAYGQDRHVAKAKTISADTTLSPSDLPWVVFDSLVVEQGATLTITPGTTIYFHNDAKLIVRGGLIAKGTIQEPVTLRGDRLDRIFTYLPYDRLNNQWGGIYAAPSCDTLILDHVDIHSSSLGLHCDQVQNDISITNSIIHNISSDCISLYNSKAIIANTQLSNAKGDCLHIVGGSTNAYHCTLAQFYPWTADRGHSLTIHTAMDDIKYPVIEANFYNCFITGYSKDEVFCYKDKEESINLNFYNCVLLTDVKDETYFHNCIAEDANNDVYKEKNFKAFDTHAFIYDLRLDSLSTARGKGNPEFSKEYPVDRYGVERGNSPDAGCYQYAEATHL